MVLNFGKYKGKGISEIMEIDPSYIAWAAGKNIINVDKETLFKAREYKYREEASAEAFFESEHGDWGCRD